MNGQDIIRLLDAAVASAEAEGAEQVPVANVRRLVDEIKKVDSASPGNVPLSTLELEGHKANLTQRLDSAKFAHDLRIEMLKAVVSNGQAAQKSAMLINGGAALALLALAGHVWPTSKGHIIIPALVAPMQWFVFSVLAGAMAAGAAYFAQGGFAGEFGKRSRMMGEAARWVTVILVFGAYGGFGRGAWLAAAALANIPS